MKRFYVAKLDKWGEQVPTKNKYLIVNIDEPYARVVFELIKNSETKKGTWDGPDTFEEFVKEL